MWNYLIDTYEGIKDETFDCDDFRYDSLVHFLEDVKETCGGIIFNMKIDPESEFYDKEYEQKINNQV